MEVKECRRGSLTIGTDPPPGRQRRSLEARDAGSHPLSLSCRTCCTHWYHSLQYLALHTHTHHPYKDLSLTQSMHLLYTLYDRKLLDCLTCIKGLLLSAVGVALLRWEEPSDVLNRHWDIVNLQDVATSTADKADKPTDTNYNTLLTAITVAHESRASARPHRVRSSGCRPDVCPCSKARSVNSRLWYCPRLTGHERKERPRTRHKRTLPIPQDTMLHNTNMWKIIHRNVCI